MSLITDLITELDAALVTLQPQIRGLHDLSAVSLSGELLAEVNQELADRERRQTLIQNAINALNALIADGYPALPQETLSQQLYQELQQQMSDLQIAAGTFQADAAASLKITLGQPTPKP